MKKRILAVILLGALFAVFVVYKYKTNYKETEMVETNTVYFLQIGAYENYSNVVQLTKTIDNYIVEEEEMYKIIVGITMNDENLEKLKEFYEDYDYNIYIREEVITNTEFLDYLMKYDDLLKETYNTETINTIKNIVLKKYEELLL